MRHLVCYSIIKDLMGVTAEEALIEVKHFIPCFFVNSTQKNNLQKLSRCKKKKMICLKRDKAVILAVVTSTGGGLLSTFTVPLFLNTILRNLLPFLLIFRFGFMFYLFFFYVRNRSPELQE